MESTLEEKSSLFFSDYGAFERYRRMPNDPMSSEQNERLQNRLVMEEKDPNHVTYNPSISYYLEEDKTISRHKRSYLPNTAQSYVLSTDAEAGITIHQLSSKLSLLMIPSVEPHHSGYYTCQASNHIGIDEFTTHLLVQGAVPPA